jgi:alanine-glyoxylate transaminase/serine-glyoxylate transaminase/serine-pyruvate transaminase
MARPTIGHLDPAFIAMMEEIKALLQYAFQTSNALTIPISAPASAGMEACFVNLIEPGEKVVVCMNGVFGERMKENIERARGVPVVVEDAWGTPVDPNKLEDALRAHRGARIVAFVQAETSTGVQSDARKLTEIAHQHDCLTIVDAVTSLGGSPLKVDEWGLDAVYSCSQEMPVVRAGAVANHLQRPRGGQDQETQDQGAKLVLRPQPRDGILGLGQARLSPHRADQPFIRPA